MAVFSAQRPTSAGVLVTYSAVAAGGDDIPVTARTVVIVRNGGASAVTVTVTAPGKTAYTVTAAAGTDTMISLLLGNQIPEGIGQTNTGSGRVKLTYSAVASVTLAVITT